MIILRPLPGSPEVVADVAAALQEEARRLAAVHGLLLDVRAGGRWDGPAGEAFESSVREVPPVVDRVVQRYAGSAAAVHRFAAEFREAQDRCQRALLAHDAARAEADRLMRIIDETGMPGDAATQQTVDALERRRQEQVLVAQDAERRYREAWQAFEAADRRCTAALGGYMHDSLDDSVVYNALTVGSRVGGSVASSAGVVAWVPWLPPLVRAPAGALAGVGGAVQTGADAALWLGYGDRDGAAVAWAAAFAVTGPVVKTLRHGARAGGVPTPFHHGPSQQLSSASRLRKGATATVGRQPLPERPVRSRFDPTTGRLLPLRERVTRRAVDTAHRAVLDDLALARRNGASARRVLAGAWTVKAAESVNTAYGNARTVHDSVVGPKQERRPRLGGHGVAP